jgi:hypothetical protein
MMFPHDSWLSAALQRAIAGGFRTLAAQSAEAPQHDVVKSVRHWARVLDASAPQASARLHQLDPNSKQASAMVDGVGAHPTMNRHSPMIRFIRHLHVTGERRPLVEHGAQL